MKLRKGSLPTLIQVLIDYRFEVIPNVLRLSDEKDACVSIYLPFYLMVCTHLLNLSVSVYRYIFVLRTSLVTTAQQIRSIQWCILSFIFISPIILTVVGDTYRDSSYLILSKYFHIVCFYQNENIMKNKF